MTQSPFSAWTLVAHRIFSARLPFASLYLWIRRRLRLCADSRCKLPEDVKEELRVGEDRTWRITEALQEQHGIQQIIDCAEQGDVVSLDTSLAIRPSTRIVIQRDVTIVGGQRLGGRSPTKRTAFICPPDKGLFLLKCVSPVFRFTNTLWTAEAASPWSTLLLKTAI